ncbi:MAG: NTP transferase domain-containing protein [Lachnospiraceae bacterium]|nr:NTP transferase domain-containing protein [Lachnospiraceae bacterium]
MKALIVNSGTGTRIGAEAAGHPKCMTPLTEEETIVSRQLRLLQEAGIDEVVMTTGLYAKKLEAYCRALSLSMKLTFVENPVFRSTNYIYSVYLAREYLEGELLFLHGDLVWEEQVLYDLLQGEHAAARPASAQPAPGSRVTVSSLQPVTEKDFKAILRADGSIEKIGVPYVTDSIALQPLYKMDPQDWRIWCEAIEAFCREGKTAVYAEDAFNAVSDSCRILPFDVEGMLCAEVDDPDDHAIVKNRITFRTTD